jgi:hypothetical protein
LQIVVTRQDSGQSSLIKAKLSQASKSPLFDL